jgi:hypothetical protein
MMQVSVLAAMRFAWLIYGFLPWMLSTKSMCTPAGQFAASPAPALLDTTSGHVTRPASDEESDYRSMVWFPDGWIVGASHRRAINSMGIRDYHGI